MCVKTSFRVRISFMCACACAVLCCVFCVGVPLILCLNMACVAHACIVFHSVRLLLCRARSHSCVGGSGGTGRQQRIILWVEGRDRRYSKKDESVRKRRGREEETDDRDRGEEENNTLCSLYFRTCLICAYRLCTLFGTL